MGTLKTLQESPVAWAILSTAAFVSIFLAIYFGIKGNKYKRITYSKKTNKIVSLKNVGVESLRLFFNEKEIEDVSITRIAIWNSGNERIDSTDIVIKKPLKVRLKEGQRNTSHILDCSIDYITDESIFGNTDPAQIELINSTYTILFDYMAPSDGLILQVVHTGEADDIDVNCQIKGGKSFDEVDNYGFLIKRKKLNKSNKLSILDLDIVYARFLTVYGAAFAILRRVLEGAILYLYLSIPIITLVLSNFPFFLWRIRIPSKINEKL